MLRFKHRQHGMSLIELAIGLLIMGILLALAAPSYMTWIQNGKVRVTAESILNGLQMARTDAVRRNTQIGFFLMSTDPLPRLALNGNAPEAVRSRDCALSVNGTHWAISFDDPSATASSCPIVLLDDAVDPADPATPLPRVIQVKSAAEASSDITVAADQSSIIFNGLGRVTPVPAAAIRIDISNPGAGACATQGGGGGPIRCLRIDVTAGGQIRLCDPARANFDPAGC